MDKIKVSNLISNSTILHFQVLNKYLFYYLCPIFSIGQHIQALIDFFTRLLKTFLAERFLLIDPLKPWVFVERPL